jgi:hypothetical protein
MFWDLRFFMTAANLGQLCVRTRGPLALQVRLQQNTKVAFVVTSFEAG